MFRFHLDLKSGVPVYRQIVDQVRGAIAAGSLSSGDQLPTVRQLAVDLEINPNTVVRAYRELEYDGLLETHQGRGRLSAIKRFRVQAMSGNGNWGRLFPMRWRVRVRRDLRCRTYWSRCGLRPTSRTAGDEL